MESVAPCNLTDARECQALVDLAVKRFGKIDILYNNAAMAYFNWLEDMSEEEWKKTLNEELVDKTWADYLTSRIMLGRPADPKEIASAALFLASSDSSYVTAADLPVDGGLIAW